MSGNIFETLLSNSHGLLSVYLPGESTGVLSVNLAPSDSSFAN